MPARIVVVLDEQFGPATTTALREGGYDTICLSDSMVALDALERAERIELLVTGLHFGVGQPNGIALARMLRLKRPGIKVLFIGPTELASHAAGLGEFVELPVSVEDVVAHAERLMRSTTDNTSSNQ